MRTSRVKVKSGRRTRGKIHIPNVKMKKGMSWLAILILFAIQLYPVALFFLGSRLWNMWKVKKQEDFRNYANIIGDRCEVSVNELSAKLGKTPSLVLNDLQAMITKGYLGDEAYIDRSRGVLVIEILESEFVEVEFEEEEDASEPEETIRPEVMSEAIFGQKREPKHAAKAEPEKEPEQDSAPSEDDFEAKLRSIRKLNDEIADEGVSERIDRIGELTASIFAVVREKPERTDEVRKFMNYYLPTTLKLLKSYSLMEKQSYQGSNIVASRKKIEDILDTLIAAFEQQQDRLFRTEALDVEADIEVLETMMAKDGLVTPKGTDLRSVMGGN